MPLRRRRDDANEQDHGQADGEDPPEGRHYKVKCGISNPAARHITNLADHVDRLQEAICKTYAMTTRYVERGQVVDEGILVYICRQGTAEFGRRFVRNSPSRGAT